MTRLSPPLPVCDPVCAAGRNALIAALHNTLYDGVRLRVAAQPARASYALLLTLEYQGQRIVLGFDQMLFTAQMNELSYPLAPEALPPALLLAALQKMLADETGLALVCSDVDLASPPPAESSWLQARLWLDGAQPPAPLWCDIFAPPAFPFAQAAAFCSLAAAPAWPDNLILTLPLCTAEKQVLPWPVFAGLAAGDIVFLPPLPIAVKQSRAKSPPVPKAAS